MDKVPYCPSVGKLYIIISMSILFTCLLTSVNIINYTENEKNGALFGTGVAINVISIITLFYLIKIDIFDLCEIYTKEKCKNKKVKYVFDRFNNDCRVVFKQNYVFLFVFLLCSVYLLAFGILKYEDIKKINDTEYYSNFTNVTIASIIFGAVGILYVLNEGVISFII
jgi:hypothetical protein